MTRDGVGDRAFALDAAVITLVSVAICVAASKLWLMTALVAIVWALRLLLWSRLPRIRARPRLRHRARVPPRLHRRRRVQ